MRVIKRPHPTRLNGAMSPQRAVRRKGGLIHPIITLKINDTRVTDMAIGAIVTQAGLTISEVVVEVTDFMRRGTEIGKDMDKVLKEMKGLLDERITMH